MLIVEVVSNQSTKNPTEKHIYGTNCSCSLPASFRKHGMVPVYIVWKAIVRQGARTLYSPCLGTAPLRFAPLSFLSVYLYLFSFFINDAMYFNLIFFSSPRFSSSVFCMSSLLFSCSLSFRWNRKSVSSETFLSPEGMNFPLLFSHLPGMTYGLEYTDICIFFSGLM